MNSNIVYIAMSADLIDTSWSYKYYEISKRIR